MKHLVIAMALLVGVACSAQSARVIALDGSDAATLKAKWDALQKAQADWNEAQETVKVKYLTVPYGDSEMGYEYRPPAASGATSGASWTTSCGIVLLRPDGSFASQTEDCKKQIEEDRERQKKARFNRRGWEYGFEFTPDFHYIVPKAAPIPVPGNPELLQYNANSTGMAQ